MKCACAEVGQGFVTLVHQIAAEVLGVDEVEFDRWTPDRLGWFDVGQPPDVDVRGRRQLGVRAVRDACSHVARQDGLDPLPGHRRRRRVVTVGKLEVSLPKRPAVTSSRRSSSSATRPRPTSTSTARATPRAFAFVAHRAVVDVDPGLGLVRVVQISTAAGRGASLNPPRSSVRSRAASPRAWAWR